MSFESLNQLLDEAINEVLLETKDHFRLENESVKEPDYEALSKESERFRGFGKHKSAQTTEKQTSSQNFQKQPNPSPSSSKQSDYQTSQYPNHQQNSETCYDAFGQPEYGETVENPYYKTFQKIRNQQKLGNPNHPPFQPDQDKAYRKYYKQDTNEQSGTTSSKQTFQTPKQQAFERTQRVKTDEKGVYAQDPDGYERVYCPPVVSRNQWGALPPMGKINPMVHPATTIMFSLNTGTPPCTTEKECTRTVRELQAKHMGEGLADIQYNFLMGGDGNLYEGRGWQTESGVMRGVEGEGVNLNIAFIGDYHNDTSKIPPVMLGPVQDLIMYGNHAKLLKGGIPKKDA